MKKNQNNKAGKVLGAAVGAVAGVAALSAAAYVLFGAEGKKHRKQIKGWAVKMKGEIIEKFEEAKEVTEPMYNKVVDEVASKYAKTKGVNEKEVKAIVADLRKHWKSLMKDAKGSKKSKK